MLSQTTSNPGAINKLTLTVVLNFALRTAGQPVLVVSNMTGIEFVAGVLGVAVAPLEARRAGSQRQTGRGWRVPVHDATAGTGHRLLFAASTNGTVGPHSSSGALTPDGELRLHVVQDLLPEVEYGIAMYTRNPTIARAGRDVHIYAAQLANDRLSEYMNTSAVQDDCTVAGACDATGDDSQTHIARPGGSPLPNVRAVLHVHGAAFSVARIAQTNPYPSSANTIHVTFAANVRFDSQAVLTVSGLRGYTTPSTTALSVAQPSAQNNLAATATWQRHTGSLAVAFTQATSEFAEYSFSVALVNPAAGQHYSAATPRLATSGVSIASTPMDREERQLLTSISHSLPGDAAPPQVRRHIPAEVSVLHIPAEASAL